MLLAGAGSSGTEGLAGGKSQTPKVKPSYRTAVSRPWVGDLSGVEWLPSSLGSLAWSDGWEGWCRWALSAAKNFRAVFGQAAAGAGGLRCGGGSLGASQTLQGRLNRMGDRPSASGSPSR